jgi:hypothetical protein
LVSVFIPFLKYIIHIIIHIIIITTIPIPLYINILLFSELSCVADDDAFVGGVVGVVGGGVVVVGVVVGVVVVVVGVVVVVIVVVELGGATIEYNDVGAGGAIVSDIINGLNEFCVVESIS